MQRIERKQRTDSVVRIPAKQDADAHGVNLDALSPTALIQIRQADSIFEIEEEPKRKLLRLFIGDAEDVDRFEVFILNCVMAEAIANELAGWVRRVRNERS